jgi:hypothetical protein
MKCLRKQIWRLKEDNTERGQLYIYLDDRWNDETSTTDNRPKGGCGGRFWWLKSLVKRAMKKESLGRLTSG